MDKWFKVAQSGGTIDGRALDGDMLEAAAKAYDLKIYTARINANHIVSMGVSEDTPFPALGTVLALKAEKEGGIVSLYAQLDPTKQLVDLVNNQQQKVFTSIELISHLEATDSPYISGLAVTDNPASLGTEMLKFCRQDTDFTEQHKLNAREYSANIETVFNFTEETADPTLLERLKAKITEKFNRQDDSLADIETGITAVAEICAQRIGELNQAIEGYHAQTATQISQLKTSLEAAQKTVDALSAQPASTLRPQATGESDFPGC